jgi:hypothetical protein
MGEVTPADRKRAAVVERPDEELIPADGLQAIAAQCYAEERERLAKMISLTWPTAAQVIREKGAL